jgi:FMN phosphatase YigB (HAD superfamily)
VAYRAVLFDLFDTLVLFDRERLPLVTINGKTQHSTAGRLHAVVARHFPALSLETVYAGLIESWKERSGSGPSTTGKSPRRSASRTSCAAWPSGGRLSPRLVQDLMDTHRRELGKAAEFPAHHGPLLRRLATRYRLAVVSNFDYSPTALDILDRAGVSTLFDAIVVSDAIGWRKPHARISRRR